MFEIDDSNYEDQLGSAELPVLLIFRASFCGPSAAIEQDIVELTEAYHGKVIVADIDIEECPKLARQMQIKATPTLVVLDLGVPVASNMGTFDYDQLVSFVERAICSK